MVNKKNTSSSTYFQFGLVGVVLLAIFLRFFNITHVPPILNRDEAALAYNAKLLLEAGKDEWGESWPIQFRSFGDYKLPGYVYTLLPFFRVFGQNDFSVRLPSAIAGVLIVAIFGILGKRFATTDDEKKKYFIFSLLFIATAPFAIFYSRMAWEANLSLAFFLGAICFLFQKKTNILHLVAGAFLYFIASFTYNTPLLLFPVLMFCFLIFHWPIKKFTIFGLGLLTFIFVIGMYAQLSIATQKGNITLFSDPTTTAAYPIFRSSLPSFLVPLFGSKHVFVASLIVKNYVVIWLPPFLAFSGGSHPWHTVPNHGHLYLPVLALGYVGVLVLLKEVITYTWKYVLLKKNVMNDSDVLRWKVVVLLFALLSPIPSIITVDSPHATRSLLFLCMILLLAVYGFFCTLSFLEKIIPKLNFSKFLILFFSVITLYQVKYFYDLQVTWAKSYPREFMVGLPAILKSPQALSEEKIAVIDPEGYLYTTVAWYKKIPASLFFNSILRHLPDQAGLTYGFSVNNYTFYKQEEDVLDESMVIFQIDNETWDVKSL